MIKIHRLYAISNFGPGCEAMWIIVASPSCAAYHAAAFIALINQPNDAAQLLTAVAPPSGLGEL
ncbi:MAG: hypothetical protein ABIN01_25735 [Ferruginibacter sp.]